MYKKISKKILRENLIKMLNFYEQIVITVFVFVFVFFCYLYEVWYGWIVESVANYKYQQCGRNNPSGIMIITALFSVYCTFQKSKQS